MQREVSKDRMSLEVFTFSFWQTRDLFHLGPSKRKEETLDEVPLKLLTLMLGVGGEVCGFLS